ncbi:MAG: ribose 5-phosphate isomerase B [Chitinophagaceae bacterium]|nr:ribose 5-phosphate isomerase B [Chitinophagaceae bacterium]
MSFAFDKDKPVAIGSDHAGFEYKEEIIRFLETRGVKCSNFGAFSKESADYPDFAHPVARSVENGESCFGILICGSANGVAMTANKHPGIRAAVCWTEEIARLARRHNNANIICIPARFVSMEESKNMLSAFMEASFEGGRHQRRVEKIACC